jgi:hypothetical protein
VKVIGSKLLGTPQNPTMLRVGMVQTGCDPRVTYELDAPENK